MHRPAKFAWFTRRTASRLGTPEELSIHRVDCKRPPWRRVELHNNGCGGCDGEAGARAQFMCLRRGARTPPLQRSRAIPRCIPSSTGSPAKEFRSCPAGSSPLSKPRPAETVNIVAMAGAAATPRQPEDVMKTVHSMIVALGLACVLSAPADAGINDPEVIIYRFPLVRDDGGGPNVGIATVFACTNFSGDGETLRFVTRDFNQTIRSNKTTFIGHLTTASVVTHPTVAYAFSLNLTTGVVLGTTAIAATSTSIICTAITIDAAAATPIGVALRGIRFSPVPDSQE